MTKVKTNLKSKLLGIIYLLSVLIILFFLFINEKGILKYLEVKDRVESLDNEIKKSEQRINKIEAELDSLKTERFKLEKTAREKYNMKRPLEKGLDVKIKNDGTQQ